MDWLRRLFDSENGGKWSRSVDHEHTCPLPALTEARGGIYRGPAGFKYIASDGDTWTCKCGRIWRVEVIEVFPPGSSRKPGRGALTLQWAKTGLIQRREW